MADNNKNRKGYKKTKIGWIPEEWEVVKIKNYGKVITGNTPPTRERSYYGNQYLFVSPADMGNSKYIYETKNKLSKKGFEISRIFPKKSVLVTCIGSTIGKIGIAYQELTSNQQINAIICYDKDSSEFLYYELLRNTDKIRNLASNQAVPIINKLTFENINIIYPPLPEQKKIAEILSTWDKAIAIKELIIKELKLRKKALMQRLLTGKVRFKEFEGQEWKEVRIKDLFKPVKRKNTIGCKRVLTASGKFGLVDQITFFKKEVASNDTSGYYLMKKGEFAYNRSLMNGYPYGATKRLDYYEDGAISTLYLCFAIKNKDIDSDFYSHYFEGGMLNKELRGIVQVGARAHGLLNVKQTDYMNIKVLRPTIEEQRKIASVLTAQDRQIELFEKQKTALEQQKKGLMQKLLTGEIRVEVN